MSNSTPPIRIVIADDHAIFREGLQRLLESEPGFEVVGMCGDGVEAVRVTVELRPDILLLDLAMPRASGIDVLRDLADHALDARIVILTAEIDSAEIVRAVQLGARGVLLKHAAIEVLYKCIRSVIAGEYWVGHQEFGRILESLRETTEPTPPRPAATLTARELQIVAAVVEGATNKDIGQQFNLSPQTVKNHLSHVFDKLGVSNRLELALYASHHRLGQRD
ncbi:MAG TPA: response regulator transcription factor [Vicinamibacterales bacterium]|jgi:DNA-binding NarL/FixJ family response regulator